MKINDALETLTGQAQDLLIENCREGAYTVPAKDLYPFQWNWDSCFTLLGWIGFNEPRAWREIETLCKGQWDSGKIPHIIFHQNSDSYFPGPDVWQTGTTPASSGISQPPVAASTVRMAYEKCENKEYARTAIKWIIPKLIKFHEWYHDMRDPEASGLIATFHPWETGRDNSVEWDVPLEKVPLDNLPHYERKDINLIGPAFRPSNDDYDRYVALVRMFASYGYDQLKLYEESPFKVADIGINTILLRANKDLLWLLEHFDEDSHAVAKVKKWISLQEKTMPRFWNDGTRAYHSIDLITGKHIPDITSASFLPFYAGAVGKAHENIMIFMLNEWADDVKYMLPSLDPSHPAFESRRYWRGPVWPIINFMVATGLSEAGHTGLSERIAKDTAQLIMESGFKEYYDPYTGEGYGGHHFSWTAAIWITWAQNFAPV